MTFTIVFPPPPPTTNTLTSRQRAQLLRKTKKLERVLGTAPHLIDAYSGDTRSLSRCSDNSTLSSTSSGYNSITPLTRQSSSSSFSARSRSVSPKVHDDFYKMKLPVLRLTLAPSDSLDTIPASPLSSTCSSPADEAGYVLRPVSNPIKDEPDSPSFTIQTNNSLRRQKLDRLRRKLGDGIPLELVFPHSDDDESSESEMNLSPRQETVKVLPRQSERTISSARDSLVLMTTSPNRAHRIKRKPVPKIVPSRPAPPPPSPPASSIPSNSFSKAKTQSRHSKPSKPTSSCSTESAAKLRDRTTKARLSLILESPDEHGHTVIEELEVSLLSSNWRSSGYDFDGWFEGMGM